MTSLDKEALDEILAAEAVAIISPADFPNTWAWYSIVSKFKPEIQQGWSKAKELKGAAKEKKLDTRGQKAAEKKVEKAKKETAKPARPVAA